MLGIDLKDTEIVLHERLITICEVDVATLIEKGRSYGDSWRKRGGVGAFMMLARKWDRIETQCGAMSYDIFEASKKYAGKEGILDDIRDLRAYLLLVEEFVT